MGAPWVMVITPGPKETADVGEFRIVTEVILVLLKAD